MKMVAATNPNICAGCAQLLEDESPRVMAGHAEPDQREETVAAPLLSVRALN